MVARCVVGGEADGEGGDVGEEAEEMVREGPIGCEVALSDPELGDRGGRRDVGDVNDVGVVAEPGDVVKGDACEARKESADLSMVGGLVVGRRIGR